MARSYSFHDAAGAARARPRIRRLAGWGFVCALLLGGQLLWLFGLRGARLLNHDALLIGGQITLAVVMLALLVLLRSTPPDAIRLPQRLSVALILGGTVLLQGAAIGWLWPVLSEDMIRYRIDGATWLAGLSPYAVSPAEWDAQSPPPWDTVDRLGLAERMYPRLHTIYPPVSQGVFVAARWIERALIPTTPAAPGPPASWREQMETLSFLQRGVVLRTIFGGMAIFSGWVLIRILTHSGQSAWWAVLLAWNPLTTLECGGMGHQDIIGILLILLVIDLARRGKPLRAAMLLALGCGVKPYALLLLPFLWRERRVVHVPAAAGSSSSSAAPEKEGGRGNAISPSRIALPLLVFTGVLILVYLPLLYHHGYVGWSATSRIYAEHWEANGSIYRLFKHFFGAGDNGWAMVHAKDMSRLFASAVLLAVLWLCWHLRGGMAQAGYWCLLTLLLTAPVMYPWYLLWVICFIPLLRGRLGYSALLWSGTASLAYLLWHQPTWNLPPWAGWVEYAPVYALLAVETATAARGRAREIDEQRRGASLLPRAPEPDPVAI